MKKSERLKDIIRQEIEEVWNKGIFIIANGIISIDYIRHEATEDIMALENYKQFVAGFYNAFPDANFKIEDMICEGDKLLSAIHSVANIKVIIVASLLLVLR